jgi:hypothetical protein
MKDKAIPTPGLANLWHAKRFPWQAVTIYFLFILSDQRLNIVKNICICTHVPDSVQTMYELPMLPSNTGGYAVAQLVEALCYKPEGRGFDSRWCHWNFSLT